jgi:hypothetical protein
MIDLYIMYFNKYLINSQIWMFVQNLNKITLSVTINLSIMENIKEKNKKFIIMYTFFLNEYFFMMNDRTCQQSGIFYLQNKNFKFTNNL